ncbi:MAG: DUF4845 domain-containing protein [Gammaproteobacteria bacterium]
MTSLKRQQGASIIGSLIILLMVAALGFFAITVGPVYLDNWTLKKMMQGLETDRSLAGLPPVTLRQKVLKRIRANGNHDLKAKNLGIVRKNDTHELTIDYVVSKPLASNMQVVMTFSEHARIPASN